MTNCNLETISKNKSKPHIFTDIDMYSIIEQFAIVVLRESRAHLKEQVSAKSLNYNQWLVLKLIYLRRADTPKRIADIIGVSPPNITRYAEQLNQKQLIKRSNIADDRRVVKFELTSKGVHVANKIYSSYKDLPKKVENGLVGQEYSIWKIITEQIEKKIEKKIVTGANNIYSHAN